MRRRRLRQRFEREYHRLAGERDSKFTAGNGLTEWRVEGLGIRPLTAAARAGYADQWAHIQERFAGTPADALAASQVLAVAVMSEQVYPAEHHDQVLADRSIEHAGTLDHYRRPRRSVTAPRRARPQWRTCGKASSTTVPCSVTSSASLLTPCPDRPRPPRGNASPDGHWYEIQAIFADDPRAAAGPAASRRGRQLEALVVPSPNGSIHCYPPGRATAPGRRPSGPGLNATTCGPDGWRWVSWLGAVSGRVGGLLAAGAAW
jgi:hypothetical protein